MSSESADRSGAVASETFDTNEPFNAAGERRVHGKRFARSRPATRWPLRRPIVDEAAAEQAAATEGDAATEVFQRERNYRLSLATADVLAFALAVPLGVGAAGGLVLRPTYLLLLPLVVLAAKITGLYDRDELVIHKATTDELPRLINLATIGVLVTWVLRRSLDLGSPRSLAPIILWAVFVALLCAFRAAARHIAARMSSVERCLLVGDKATFDRLAAKFTHNRHIELVSFVPLSELDGAGALRLLAYGYGVHRIIIAAGDAGENDTTLDLVRAAKSTGLRVSLLPGILGAVGSSVVFDDLWGMTVLGVPRFGLSRSSGRLKRAFDLIVALPATLLLLPAMAVVALIIKLDSPGPVFFRQTRVGRDGDHFSICKFRTMVDGADAMKPELLDLNEGAAGLFKIADDPRITRSGKWLRRSCLDELPQLFNVLRGEMSLVGPRPLVVNEDERIKGLDRNRLHLTPGITGPWQILGSARIPLAEMVKLDYLYIANWSLWSDVKILLRTVPMVVERRGQ